MLTFLENGKAALSYQMLSRRIGELTFWVISLSKCQSEFGQYATILKHPAAINIAIILPSAIQSL